MRSIRYQLWLALWSSAVLLAQPAWGADERQALMLAAACFNCHGTDGRLTHEQVPAIADLPAPALLARLRAFQRGEVPGTTVMDRITSGFTDAELQLLADYFAGTAQGD